MSSSAFEVVVRKKRSLEILPNRTNSYVELLINSGFKKGWWQRRLKSMKEEEKQRWRIFQWKWISNRSLSLSLRMIRSNYLPVASYLRIPAISNPIDVRYTSIDDNLNGGLLTFSACFTACDGQILKPLAKVVNRNSSLRHLLLCMNSILATVFTQCNKHDERRVFEWVESCVMWR